ncbi:MAG: hypothetical protein QM774_05945 [Gordonia sp. (in: high G+C Gram-positive bacteria)]|uniref:hypothetical protein n=1 Tax=Gordonia sp. (in: high G+C Gram-positive bacteria) TaxID=84139 RepID=UPI0039E271BA
MIIDCATCPARNRACDDCLMQVFFAPATRDYGPDEQLKVTDRALHDALDVFVATQLISPTEANAAKTGIDAGDDDNPGDDGRYLRAV